MQLLNKTQVEKDIENITAASDTFANALNAAIFTLNLCYDALWKLPDDRLRDALQKLLDDGKLQSLFEDHNFSATSLNAIKQKGEYSGYTAYDAIGREFTIDANGVVTVTPIPEVVSETVIETE
jgi:hypothetical protein